MASQRPSVACVTAVSWELAPLPRHSNNLGSTDMVQPIWLTDNICSKNENLGVKIEQHKFNTKFIEMPSACLIKENMIR